MALTIQIRINLVKIDLKIKIQGSERIVSALTKQQVQVDLREKINASRAAKLAPSEAAASRSTSQKHAHSIVKEADMDTQPPPSSQSKKNSETCKAKGRSSKERE